MQLAVKLAYAEAINTSPVCLLVCPSACPCPCLPVCLWGCGSMTSARFRALADLCHQERRLVLFKQPFNSAGEVSGERIQTWVQEGVLLQHAAVQSEEDCRTGVQTDWHVKAKFSNTYTDKLYKNAYWYKKRIMLGKKDIQINLLFSEKQSTSNNPHVYLLNTS